MDGGSIPSGRSSVKAMELRVILPSAVELLSLPNPTLLPLPQTPKIRPAKVKRTVSRRVLPNVPTAAGAGAGVDRLLLDQLLR